MKTVNELIKDINSLTSHLHEKDFLLTWEQTPDELKQVLDVAAALKALRVPYSATTPPVPASLMLPRLTCSALHNKISTKANHKSLTAKPCVKPPI